MPFNGSGTFTLAQAAFVPNTPISSSAMNSDLSDIATNGLTNAVTKDGQTTITGPFKGANGSVGLPMYSFASDTNTGMYRHGADELAFSTAGTLAGWFNSSQKFFMLGAADIAGLLNVTGASTYADVATFNTTDNIKIPVGTTGQRSGSPVEGMLRENSTLHLPEIYNGSTWVTMAALLMPSSFKNLSIKVATNTTVAVAADFVATTDGSSFQLNPVSATIDLGANGAVNRLDTGTIAVDTFYAIWVIAKADGTTGGLASLSATSPTMPSGYTFKARVGWVQTIHASAILYGTWQFGRIASYVAGLAGGTPGATTTPGPIAFGTTGTYSLTSPTLIATTVVGNGKYVPSTASRIQLAAAPIFGGAGAGVNISIAPSQAYSGTNNGSGGSNKLPYPFDSSNSTAVWSGWITLETTTVSVSISGANGAINCLGWEDNI